MGLHLLKECNRLTLAVCRRGGLDFLRGLPFRAESVWNLAETLNPLIYQPEGDCFLRRLLFRDQDGADAGHLAIVRGILNAEQDRLSETGENGEAEEAGDKKEDFAELERMDAYKNHS